MSRKQLAIREGKLLAPQMDYILLDGSSSMASKWYDTLRGLDAFMDVLRANNIHSHGVLSMFNGQIGDVYLDSVISQWPAQLSDAVPGPSGMTSLYDAIGMMVREMAHLDPDKASIVIVTDGDDTSSTHIDVVQAKALLDWCRAKGWQVTFLGADFNNEAQAGLLGADSSNSVGVAKKMLAAAGKSLGEKRARHAMGGADMNFSGEEKQQFGGYLGHG